MALTEIFVVLIGFQEAPGYLQLASSVFVTPAVGIVGGLLTAVVGAGEDEAHAARHG